MKKVLIITLLPLILSVSGCKEKEVKKPSFKRYSNEVSYDDFMSAEASLVARNSILSVSLNPNDVPSFEASFSRTSKTKDVKSTIATGEKKSLSDNSVQAHISGKVKFDAAKTIATYSASRDATVIVSSNNGKKITEAVGYDSRDFQMQMHEVEDSDPVAYLYNNKTSIAFNTGASASNLKVGVVEISTSSISDKYRPSVVAWASYTTEERQTFKFYVDDNVLTCVQKGKLTTETKNESDELVYSSIRNISVVSQFVYGETTYSQKVYVDNSYKSEAYDTYSSYTKGDIDGGNELTAVEISIKANDKISLNEKADADYHIANGGNVYDEYYTSLLDGLDL